MINGKNFCDPNKVLPNHLPRRLRESKLILTINPNKIDSPDHLKEIANAAWATGLAMVEDGVTRTGKCLAFGPVRSKEREHYCHGQLKDVVVGIPELEAGTLEVGPKQHRLHTHAYVSIKHCSQIHLDEGKIIAGPSSRRTMLHSNMPCSGKPAYFDKAIARSA
mmetsp:Transcript_39759/g.105041  ORF Transcript_39759/g.105041 Transcript_39759/m.105041 type:complete len:164 (-) Transcript_39759:1811-2302(-)